MTLISATLDVDVPVRQAYEHWTRFEEYPRILHDIIEVERINDDLLRWRGRVAGMLRDWSARVTERHVDRMVAWTSDGAVRCDGLVTLEPLSARSTRVTLWLDFGRGTGGATARDDGEGLGVIRNRALGDLERFRALAEGAAPASQADGVASGSGAVGRIA